MKKLLGLIKWIFFAGVLISAVMGAIIGVFGMTAKPRKSDCIIILGCQVRDTTPSRFLAERLNRGIELYNQGYGKYIIVSGGQGPGESISEAEAMKVYLVSRGVDENKIIMEDASGSTMENLKYSKLIMEEKNFSTAVVVSNRYHLKRASIMVSRTGIDASYSGIYVSKYFFNEIYGFLREIPAIIRLLILGR